MQKFKEINASQLVFLLWNSQNPTKYVYRILIENLTVITVCNMGIKCCLMYTEIKEKHLLCVFLDCCERKRDIFFYIVMKN